MKMKGAARKPVQILIFLGVLLLGGYAIGKTLFASKDGLPMPGDKPPEFTLSTLDGRTVSLSDYEGKPVVLNFWGSFCPPCVKEMPEFQRQYDKWKSEGLEVLAVNLSEDNLTVRNFVAGKNLTYPILRDVDKETERRYRLRSYPTTFFIRPDGKLEEVYQGGMTEQDIEERVLKLIEES
ncbi:redoxin domain-containing protein [Paenibacillus pasadenensis]|uniref:Cytochrome c-type biogenesis protein ResA n=1 Tax=Paenibacillus pasadenensis TaxID=217090 RepID=A0A2N5N5I1_9BACL|nr:MULTISPECIES: redoxin domain-containing protein [Paenibacillus]PLT45607.1 Cytochrome c-type biogenesis protein ResA [Paenibacillus pasadenensis]